MKYSRRHLLMNMNIIIRIHKVYGKWNATWSRSLFATENILILWRHKTAWSKKVLLISHVPTADQEQWRKTDSSFNCHDYSRGRKESVMPYSLFFLHLFLWLGSAMNIKKNDSVRTMSRFFFYFLFLWSEIGRYYAKSE